MSASLIFFDVVMAVSGHRNSIIRAIEWHFAMCFKVEMYTKMCQ